MHAWLQCSHCCRLLSHLVVVAACWAAAGTLAGALGEAVGHRQQVEGALGAGATLDSCLLLLLLLGAALAGAATRLQAAHRCRQVAAFGGQVTAIIGACSGFFCLRAANTLRPCACCCFCRWCVRQAPQHPGPTGCTRSSPAGPGPAGNGGSMGGGGSPGFGPAGSGGGLGSGTLDRPPCGSCLPSSAACFSRISSSCRIDE